MAEDERKPTQEGDRGDVPPPATPEEEPETYDLAFDPEEEDGDKPTGSAAALPSLDPRAADPDTPPAPAAEEPRPDPRAGNVKGINRSSTAVDTPDAPDAPAEEPVAVSPAKAQARREEQRLRAAQELAEEDARKKKRTLIVAGLAVAAVLVLYFGWQLM